MAKLFLFDDDRQLNVTTNSPSITRWRLAGNSVACWPVVCCRLPADGQQQQQQQLAGWWCWLTTNVTFWPLVIGKSWKEEKERKQIKIKQANGLIFVLLDGLTRRPFQRMNNCRPMHKTFWALNTVNTHTPNVLFSFQKMREKKPLCSLNSHTRTESNTGHTAHKHTSEKSFFSVICLNQKKI